MALNLQQIRAKLQQEQDRKDKVKSGGGFNSDSAVYPFWNIPDNTTATIRYLPDGDEKNDFFWVERLLIKLPFQGIKGQNDNKMVEVQVPCMDMWKPGSCPILAETRAWWKDPSLEDMARKYWKKKTYIFQGFVNQNPLTQDNTPENPIRRFMINTTIYDIIKTILMRQDVEHTPTDYENGRDFYLTKSTKGKFANYQSSSWGMRERALSTNEREAIEKFGLPNLSQFLPKKPDETALRVIMEMFHASVNEEQYDTERWGEYFRPFGLKSENSESEVAVEVTKPSTTQSVINRVTQSINTVAKKVEQHTTPTNVVEEETVTPTTTAVDTSSKAKMNTPEDILAAIRRRTSGK
jgi:hypothetical protein